MSTMLNKKLSGRSYRSTTPLTDDQIRNVAPSIFAVEPWGNCSDRYIFIPTAEIMQGLRNNGFMPYEVQQARSNIEGKQEFTRHLIKFRKEGEICKKETNEIVLYNSHDTGSSYQLSAGRFIQVCSNGLVVGSILDEVRIRHSGNKDSIYNDVIEAAYKIIDGFDVVDEHSDIFKQIQVDDEERMLLAETAMNIRYEDQNQHRPIEPKQLLTPRRYTTEQNLWNTTNLIQENIMKGGIHGMTANNKRTSTRKVNGIGENIKYNKAIWDMMEKFAEMKVGKLQ